jgi:hypothetical protein
MRRLAVVAGVVALSLLGTAQAEVVSGGNVRVSFRGWISPQKLPRSEAAPIALHVAGTVEPVGDRRPASLARVTVEINRHGVVTTRGLPTCPWRLLMAVTTRRALAVCGDALIGTGHFTSHIDIPEQAPFPAVGRLLAFNSSRNGKPAVAAHVYGTDPVPTSEVLRMTFSRRGQGSFGPIVTVEMPKIGNEWGYVNGFDLTLKRRYRYHGRAMSLISASCPAPAGVREAPFKAARGIYELADGRTLTRTLSGSCQVARRP